MTYWRRGDEEVDFVVAHGARTWAVEVKSGRGYKTSGLAAFTRQYPGARPLIIGNTGIPLDRFFSTSPLEWFT